MRGVLVLVTLLVLGTLGWFVTRPRESAPTEASPPTVSQTPGQVLPDLTFTDYSGQPVHFRDLRGTPLVVNSWAAWCPFCVKELPDLAAVQEEFGNRVKILAVNRAESLGTAKGFTDQLGVSEKLVHLLDPQDEFYSAIGGFAMPETLFVDAAGSVVFQKRGVMTREEIRERTTDLIGQEKQ